MNIRQKAQIETMKKQGCTIRKISNELNVPVGTIKSYLSRRKSFRQCECCGKSLSITSAHIKRFCSDKCRMKWWRENKEVSLKMTKKFALFVIRYFFLIRASNKFIVPDNVPERQGGKMNRNIIIYQVMVEIIKTWLRSGKISRKDYAEMNTKMAEKYGISLSGIFVDKSENPC